MNRSLPRLVLFQAALGQFIRFLVRLGCEIDAGRLRSGAVVIDDNSSGPAIYLHRCQGRGTTIDSEFLHATTRRGRRGTVLAQTEEEEIGSSGADIGIEELRPSRAPGGSRVSYKSRDCLCDRRGRLHGAPGEREGVLPGCRIGRAGSTKMDQSSRGIVVVIVVESGLVKVDRGGSEGAYADCGFRQQSQCTGIGFENNGAGREASGAGGAAIGADYEGCAVGDIDNRRGQDS